MLVSRWIESELTERTMMKKLLGEAVDTIMVAALAALAGLLCRETYIGLAGNCGMFEAVVLALLAGLIPATFTLWINEGGE